MNKHLRTIGDGYTRMRMWHLVAQAASMKESSLAHDIVVTW